MIIDLDESFEPNKENESLSLKEGESQQNNQIQSPNKIQDDLSNDTD